MNKNQLGAYAYLFYYLIRLIFSNATVALFICAALFSIAQFVYPGGVFEIDHIQSLYNSQDVEIRAAIISSSITIAGILLTVIFASAQWKKDTNAKRNIELAGNLVSIMHDFHFLVTEVRLFAEYTRDILVVADQFGFDNVRNQYEYWKKRRKEASENEEKLWRLWHEYNRWTAIGKSPLTVLGLSNITDKVSAIISSAKIRSSSIDFYCPSDGYPDIDIVLECIDLYCVDLFIDDCKRDSTYIAVNASALNDILLRSLKEYSVKEFMFILKIASEMDDFVHLLKTGEHRGLKKMLDAYKSSQKFR